MPPEAGREKAQESRNDGHAYSRTGDHDHRPVADERGNWPKLSAPSRSSSTEVIEAHLRRIDEVIPRSTPSSSCWASRRWKRPSGRSRGRRGGDLPPFHGCRHGPRASIRRYPNHPGAAGAGRCLPQRGCSRRRTDANCRGCPDRPHQLLHHHGSVAHRQRALGGDRQSLGPFSNTGCSSGGEAAAVGHL